MRLLALTRSPTPAIRNCELTHLNRAPIDVDRARRQHAEYERQLEELGCSVERLPELPDQPDAVFVEDTVVVLPEVAVITRSGAASRRPETESMAEAMARYRPLAHIQFPATLDGGDLLRLGERLYVGQSSRTSPAGLEQLKNLVEPYGYEVVGVPVKGCLHLKTAVAEIADNTVLINPEWVDAEVFEGLQVIEGDPDEIAVTSTLRVGDTVLITADSPRTREKLEGIGCKIREIDYSELAKAEAGLTCCSVIFEHNDDGAPA